MNSKPSWYENLVTPGYIFHTLDEEYHFTLDVCASPENTKCKEFFDKTKDGLIQPWTGVCWMNPPYNTLLSQWIRKAYVESWRADLKVVCLLPARTDTVVWHEYIMKAEEIRFVKGRIKFVGQKDPAPFPSCVVVFSRTDKPTKYSSIIF